MGVVTPDIDWIYPVFVIVFFYFSLEGDLMWRLGLRGQRICAKGRPGVT